MNRDRVDQIIDEHRSEASSLIQVLLDVQSENHWLPAEALQRICERLEVPLALVHSAEVSSLQVPDAFAMQHAPVGWGQRFGLQVVPEPW